MLPFFYKAKEEERNSKTSTLRAMFIQAITFDNINASGNLVSN